MHIVGYQQMVLLFPCLSNKVNMSILHTEEIVQIISLFTTQNTLQVHYTLILAMTLMETRFKVAYLPISALYCNYVQTCYLTMYSQ